VAAVLAIASLFPLLEQIVEDVLYSITVRGVGFVEREHIDEDNLIQS
jgi:hypothetical protein